MQPLRTQPREIDPFERIATSSRQARKGNLSRGGRLLTIVNVAALVVCVWYAYAFVADLSDFWFNPDWTTDDALQQTFPFHRVFKPENFEGDMIADVMEGYLAPLHYWLSYAFTWLTGDPIMMAHWVMLIQIGLACVFMFLAVHVAAGVAPALLSVAWLLHTRPVMQRMTSGLPRGWAAPVLAAFIYFMLRRNHKAVLLTLLCGCLLHPPATLIAAVAYGLYLLVGTLRPSTRQEFRKPLIVLLLLSPLYIGTVAYVVHRPPEVGTMVDYKTASAMPEFQRPDGRFPFLPLDAVDWELKMYAFQPFFHRLHAAGLYWNGDYVRIKNYKLYMAYGVSAALLLLIGIGIVRRKPLVPIELLILGAAIMLVYFASRQVVFKLYVPNRHLQFPMTMFLIPAFCIGLWRLGHRAISGEAGWRDSRLRQAWPAVVLLLGLAGVVIVGTGDGLYGSANFNYSRLKKGRAFEWLRKYSPPDALVAGHPTHIDALPLFGERKAFATTEATHPFYPGYLYEMERRLIISLKAHYARTLQEVADLLEPEGIDYFVFSRKRFYPHALKEERFFAPLNVLVQELTSRPYPEYAYREMPHTMNLEEAPYMVFKDMQSAVVDLHKLRVWLDAKKQTTSEVVQ